MNNTLKTNEQGEKNMTTDNLQEIKRLRERLIRAYDWVENVVNGNESAMMDYTEYVCGGEELKKFDACESDSQTLKTKGGE
tara:strand:+ start:725 stop:967 length:243 start_codon:yes stop_codon:yes gene_type:complete